MSVLSNRINKIHKNKIKNCWNN